MVVGDRTISVPSRDVLQDSFAVEWNDLQFWPLERDQASLRDFCFLERCCAEVKASPRMYYILHCYMLSMFNPLERKVISELLHFWTPKMTALTTSWSDLGIV